MSKEHISKGRQAAAAKRAAQKKEALQRKFALALVPLVLIGGLVFFGLSRQASAPEAADLTAVSAANIDGSPDAPIQIVEFGDFGCPSCRAWHQAGIKGKLQATYGDQISFTFRHFPVITASSPQAAEAAQCAADQDAFWPYHDFVYERGSGLTTPQLIEYAAAIGLNTIDFSACLENETHKSYVNNDMRAARQAGARGTPTFLVNGQLVGHPTYENLAQAIEVALEQ